MPISLSSCTVTLFPFNFSSALRELAFRNSVPTPAVETEEIAHRSPGGRSLRKVGASLSNCLEYRERESGEEPSNPVRFKDRRRGRIVIKEAAVIATLGSTANVLVYNQP
jgi:hypothetical protein